MEYLQERIGYQFVDEALLIQALTHPSGAAEREDLNGDNQRLEFLGDAVLQLVLTERLYLDYEDFAEGILTPMRSRLVSGPALARQARTLKLGEYLVLGRGEESNGGRDRDSLLADAFEALLGAVYLDGGLEQAKQVIERCFVEAIKEVENNPDEISPKGRLQITLQALGNEGPIYEVVEEEGPDHERLFHVEVSWRGHFLGRGEGRNKKAAEKDAARAALETCLWKEMSDFT